jgi:ketosteroid isomerase-like protein
MGRHLDERLLLAAPWLSRQFRRMLFRLHPGSTLRRRVLKRFAVRGWEAFARGDFEAALIAFDAAYEINLYGEMLKGLGFDSRYLGYAGLKEFGAAWRAVWSSIEYAVDDFIDLGDRIVLRFTTTTRGAASGAEVSQTAGSIYFIEDARIVRQDFYWDWADCARVLRLDG